ncbi:signal peptidase II [Candidatus Woesearchaeota archaeon]|nr:signal peptidase II [Candidatus Woesearchaeota archaeon]
MKKLLTISLSVLLLDQLTKYFFKNKLISITSFFRIGYVENTGAAFGILKGFKILFILVALAVIFFIFKYYDDIKKEKPGLRLAIGLLLGGVAGNLIDRVFLGFVRDFLDFSFWPTFNVADACSTVGVVILTYHILFKK